MAVFYQNEASFLWFVLIPRNLYLILRILRFRLLLYKTNKQTKQSKTLLLACISTIESYIYFTIEWAKAIELLWLNKLPCISWALIAGCHVLNYTTSVLNNFLYPTNIYILYHYVESFGNSSLGWKKSPFLIWPHS